MIGTTISVNSQTVVCSLVSVFIRYNFLFFAQNGKTALYLASERGYVSIVQVLIGAHADVSLQDKVLCTSRMYFHVFDSNI